MKSINNYLTESMQMINEGKAFELTKCPGWSFSFIGIKDRWGTAPGGPRMKYALVCTPKDKTKDIVVFKNYAWYKEGYDQGHASPRQFYLNTLAAGGRGNGHGVDREVEPYYGDLDLDAEHLNCYLNGKKDWSDSVPEKFQKAASTYDRKTKKADIKKDLSY